MKQKSRIPTLIAIVISVGMLILMILSHRNAVLIVNMSLILAFSLCLYLRETPLFSKRWLKRVDKAIRVAWLICVLLMFVLFVIYDWPAV